MADLPRPRRIVTGLDVQGRSCVLIDGPSTPIVWRTAGVPADNAPQEDAGGGTFAFPEHGTQFVVHDFPPGGGSPWHATDTIDYISILSGEIVLVLEADEVSLRAGDVLVDRGAVHAWRNDNTETCRMTVVLSPALPLGKGATHKGEVQY